MISLDEFYDIKKLIESLGYKSHVIYYNNLADAFGLMMSKGPYTFRANQKSLGVFDIIDILGTKHRIESDIELGTGIRATIQTLESENEAYSIKNPNTASNIIQICTGTSQHFTVDKKIKSIRAADNSISETDAKAMIAFYMNIMNEKRLFLYGS